MKKYLFFIVLVILTASCSPKQDERNLQLKKASFADMKGFADDNMHSAYDAFMQSCNAIRAQSGEHISSTAAIKISRKDYVEKCNLAASIKPENFSAFIKENFTPYLVLHSDSSKGKFTSYYESQINASYVKDEVYKYPVYGRPYDLVEVNLQDFDKSLPNKKVLGRVEGEKLVPYYSREQIFNDGINAPVILWADSYIDVYIMQIQGSAVAKLNDGSEIRISFRESNGLPFRGIGSILLQKGLIKSGEASMGSIKQWLKNNPEIAIKNMNENQRYIFHRLGNPDGPMGAQGVPLTPGRSLAVDRNFIPLGSLLWLETSHPDKGSINKLVLAQDIGSAIKGGVRGDYFWGSGGDDVLSLAGKMNSEGQYYILIPNQTEGLDGKTN